MLNLKKTATILLILTSMTTIQAQTLQDALSVITTYAEDGNSVPTVADYVDLGMTEIGTHNIDAINDKIATLPQTAIDTAEKIQKLIDTHNLMIHAVLNVVTTYILSEPLDTDHDGIPDDRDPYPNEVGTPTDFSGVTTYDGPFGSKGFQGTITDSDGITSVEIDFSDGSHSTYSDGNLTNEGTHMSGITYTITVIDNNGNEAVKTGTF